MKQEHYYQVADQKHDNYETVRLVKEEIDAKLCTVNEVRLVRVLAISGIEIVIHEALNGYKVELAHSELRNKLKDKLRCVNLD